MGKHLLCAVVAAGSPLTVDELADLISLSSGLDVDVPGVRTILRQRAAGMVHRVMLPEGVEAFRLGHHTLDDQVIENLSPRTMRAAVSTEQWERHREEVLAPWRSHIHQWVESFARRGWSPVTPRYAGAPYFELLSATDDLPRITALAEDSERQDFLAQLTGSHYQAFREVRTAAQRHARRHSPDLRLMVRLSVMMDALSDSLGSVPLDLLGAWAAIGDVDHALHLVEALDRGTLHSWGLVTVVRALSPTDPDHAERVAAMIAEPESHADALLGLANTLASTDAGRAERLIAAIDDPGVRAGALVSLAKSVVSLDREWAERLVARAQPLIDLIDDADRWVDETLVLAETLVHLDPAGVMDQVGRVERRITGDARLAGRAEGIRRLVQILSSVEGPAAENLIGRIDDRELWLSAVVALARADSRRAQCLVSEAEQWVNSIADPEDRAEATVTMIEALACVDLDRAEETVAAIDDASQQLTGLMNLVEVLAQTDADRAERVVTRIARSPWQIPRVLAVLVQALAPRNPERAEQIAAGIDDPYWQGQGLVSLVGVLAPGSAFRALEVAERIRAPGKQAEALATVARHLASSDQDAAVRLLRRAERLAGEDDNSRMRDEVLASFVWLLAPSDPGRAEQLTDMILHPEVYARAVSALVRALVPGDVSQADRLVRLVEGSFGEVHVRAQAAVMLGPVDPELSACFAQAAEEAAIASPVPFRHVDVLIALAQRLAATDPDHARDVMDRAIHHAEAAGRLFFWHEMTQIAPVLAAFDVDRAEELVSRIGVSGTRIKAMVAVIEAVAPRDPDRARRWAESFDDAATRATAFAAMAHALSGVDPHEAREYMQRAEDAAMKISDQGDLAWARATMARTWAGLDIDRAEQLIEGIDHPYLRDPVLSDLADALKTVEPRRAERFAEEIVEPRLRVEALAGISGVESLPPAERDRLRARVDDLLASALASGGWYDVLTVLSTHDPAAFTTLIDTYLRIHGTR